MISKSESAHCGDVEAAFDLTRQERVALNARVEAWVEEYLDFVWRSLRSLGISAADCDDGCQKVWWVVARKAPQIEPGKERSFIFSVVVRVASEMRRRAARDSTLPLDPELPSAEPGVEELCEQRRARGILENLLGGMPWEQRLVFVMFELEGLSTHDIAHTLNIPRGTVASRLRLARDCFNRALARYQSCYKSGVRLAASAREALRLAGAYHE